MKNARMRPLNQRIITSSNHCEVGTALLCWASPVTVTTKLCEEVVNHDADQPCPHVLDHDAWQRRCGWPICGPILQKVFPVYFWVPKGLSLETCLKFNVSHSITHLSLVRNSTVCVGLIDGQQSLGHPPLFPNLQRLHQSLCQSSLSVSCLLCWTERPKILH